MTRRSLFRMFGGAAAAYVCPLPAVVEVPVEARLSTTTVLHLHYDPMAYMGEWKWISIAPASGVTREFLDDMYQKLTK